jgi:hypothetical protein
MANGSRRPSLLNRTVESAAPDGTQAKAKVAIFGVEGRSPEMGIRVTLEDGTDYVFPYSTLTTAARKGDQLEANFGAWKVTCFLSEKGAEDLADLDSFSTMFEALRTQTLVFLRASKEAGFSIEVEEVDDDDES